MQRIVKILSWVPVVYVVNAHVVSTGVVTGHSMAPTFNAETPRTWVLLWKWGAKSKDAVKEGDVVFLTSPIDASQLYTKRVKAVAGQLVQPRHPDTRRRVLIPQGHVWVEGDNVHSIDSNTYGPISRGLLVGRVVFSLWPFGFIPQQGGRHCLIK